MFLRLRAPESPNKRNISLVEGWAAVLAFKEIIATKEHSKDENSIAGEVRFSFS